MAVASAVEEQREKFAAALKFIEEVTTNSDEVQRKVLAEILSLNAETEYLKRHGLNGATDRETFKNKVPVVTYEDIQPDIRRIANGDFSPILCAQPISEFLTSSGTSSGERKLFPTTAEDMDRKMFLTSVFTPVLDQCMPNLDKGKGLNFQFIKPEIKTPGGLVAHPVSTSYLKSLRYKNCSFNPNDIQTSPIEAILCTDAFQSMYTQMICGLYDRLEVTRIGAIFPTVLLRAVQFLKVHHHDLCHDISTSTLNLRITDHALRAHMTNNIMRPDADLAAFINRTCQEENWEEGFIRRIWPNAKYLTVIVTGSMAQYIPSLDYYSGGLPKLSFGYASSECFFGLNLKPLSNPSEISYTLFPNMAYFEFIPLDGSTHFARDSMPRLVDLVDVEVGKDYEIVVTTYAGLYRYRIGDVLRVTGFHNSAPQFKFVRRENVLLSIDTEKTDEIDLQKAIEKASKLLQAFNTSIMEYTSYANTKVIPGHYVIYLELMIKDSMNGPSPEVLGQCCLELEEALNSVYRRCRLVDQSIGPLEIRVVKSGTFEELMDHAISLGGSMSQYKVPRCLNVMSMVDLLDSRVVSAHVSPSMPHWSPECHV